MEFHSKRDYLYFSIFALTQLIAIFNPTTVSSLKVLCVLFLIMIFYFTMTTHTVIINKDSIQFSKQLFSFTFSQRSVRVESIEKIEKNIQRSSVVKTGRVFTSRYTHRNLCQRWKSSAHYITFR